MNDIIMRTSPFALRREQWQLALHIGFVLLLAFVGYQLAPPDIKPGVYTAELSVMVREQTIRVDFPFTIASQTEYVIRPIDHQHEAKLADGINVTIFVTGMAYYPYQLGERIFYRIRAIDARGIPVELALNAATSTLRGPGYQQQLPPTAVIEDETGTWLQFTMRMPIRAKIILALLFAVAALWLTELVPLAATALLIPIVAVVAEVANATTVLQSFAHPIIMLFLAGFLMAEGMRRTGIDRWVALNILQYASLQPAYLMLTMMGLTAFLSMWMSNTASVAVIVPIALAILAKIPDDQEPDGFHKALILAVAYSATIGGIGSAIGTPANMIALTFLNDYVNTELAFIDWFVYGIPMVILMLPVIWLYLLFSFRLHPRKIHTTLDREHYHRELVELGPLQGQQRWILLIFCTVMLLWLTEEWHTIPTAIVALGGAFSLFLLRIIEQDDLHRINWNALLTFGGGLAIGTLLVSTGVSDWIALQLVGLNLLPSWLVIFLVAGLTLITGAFISNTACAAMLIPLAIPLAQLLGFDPRLLVAVVAIASSIDFALVVGTPPTMMAYSTGFFQTSEIFRRGVLLDLLGVLLLSFVVIWIWWLLGVVTLS